MRNWIFFLLIIISLSSFSQKNDSTIFINPELPAHFPGGEDAMWCFIEANLNFNIINSSNDSGVIWTRFNVEVDGSIDSIKILAFKSKDNFSTSSIYIIQNEIIRVIDAMPKWEPMKWVDKNKPLRSKYNLPIPIPYTSFHCPMGQIRGNNQPYLDSISNTINFISNYIGFVGNYYSLKKNKVKRKIISYNINHPKFGNIDSCFVFLIDSTYCYSDFSTVPDVFYVHQNAVDEIANITWMEITELYSGEKNGHFSFIAYTKENNKLVSKRLYVYKIKNFWSAECKYKFVKSKKLKL